MGSGKSPTLPRRHLEAVASIKEGEIDECRYLEDCDLGKSRRQINWIAIDGKGWLPQYSEHFSVLRCTKHKDCVDKFEFEGTEYHGCTHVDAHEVGAKEPVWCSKAEVFRPLHWHRLPCHCEPDVPK